MMSLQSSTPESRASEADDVDDELTFTDAAGTPPPKSKHRHQARADFLSEAYEKLLAEGEQDGWARVNELQGVTIWKKADDSSMGIVKGVGIVERAKPYEVIAVASTIDIREHWDSLFAGGRLVEVLDPYYRVHLTYGYTKPSMAVSSRDVVLCHIVTEKPNGTIYSITGSIVDSKVSLQRHLGTTPFVTPPPSLASHSILRFRAR